MTVPHESTDLSRWITQALKHAEAYVRLGWRVFILGRGKTPLRNCATCDAADWTHDRDRCACLTCHGFYAATTDLERVARMLRVAPGGLLAVRTGVASHLLVIDAESTEVTVKSSDAGGRVEERVITGLDVLDEWEQWTGVTLPPTLQQRTRSGGLHKLYALTGDEPTPAVKSRGRILPQVDVKGDGGYIAVPTPGSGRSWDLGGGSRPTAIGSELLTWLATQRGSGTMRDPGSFSGGDAPDGYNFKRACETGARDGERDVFFRDLIYAHRRAGVDRDVMERIALHHWRRCEQPPSARWLMPWDHVLYKIEHTWRSVQPELLGEDDWRVRAARRLTGEQRATEQRGSGVESNRRGQGRPGIQRRGTHVEAVTR